jgi:hypothetical protein
LRKYQLSGSSAEGLRRHFRRNFTLFEEPAVKWGRWIRAGDLPLHEEVIGIFRA